MAEDTEPELSELQLRILDGMADDYEDIEQLYLYANRKFSEEETKSVGCPSMILRVDFPLREIVDEVRDMINSGFLEVKYSNDERFAPLSPLNLELLHHYWFGPTERGKQAWKTWSKNQPPSRT